MALAAGDLYRPSKDPERKGDGGGEETGTDGSIEKKYPYLPGLFDIMRLEKEGEKRGKEEIVMKEWKAKNEWSKWCRKEEKVFFIELVVFI